MTRELILSKGYVAIVDDDDYERVGQFKWTAVVTGQNIKRIYAFRPFGWDNSKRRHTGYLLLHRSLMDVPKGVDIDHINGDTLNRRANLRLATRSQNLANNRRATGKTGYRGVTFDKNHPTAPYRAQLANGGSSSYIGAFSTPIEAAMAYDQAALEKFGEFAKTNALLGLL